MNVFKHFSKNRLIYFFITLLLVVLFSILTGPLYEVHIDIKINPPENIRKTDFSWITVNQWFHTQERIITSYSVLKNVKSKISTARLKKIISAKRLGATDILRLSVRSRDGSVELEEIVYAIVDSYFRQFDKKDKKKEADEKEATLSLAQIVGIKHADSKISSKKSYDVWYGKRAQIEKEIGAACKLLKSREIELESIETRSAKLMETRKRIEEIDSTLSPMKKRLAELRLVYANGWSQVSDLKQKIYLLEKQKAEFNRTLMDAQEMEDTRLDLMSRIRKDKEDIESLQNKYEAIDSLLKVATDEKAKTMKKIAMHKAKSIGAYIINPPERTLLPEFGLRFLLASSFGLLFWFLIVFFFRKG